MQTNGHHPDQPDHPHPFDRLKAAGAMLLFLADAVLSIAREDELTPSAAEGLYYVLQAIRTEVESAADRWKTLPAKATAAEPPSP